jgi:hypothetical protein
MVTLKPVSPAHCLCNASSSLLGTMCTKFSMAVRSYMPHVLPIEKVPFAFSRALCSLTILFLVTDIMMMRGFFFCALALGGGGDCG